MVIKVRINGNKFYNLVRWNAGDFNTNLTLYIQSMDLQDVTQTFTSVNKIEIFKDDAPVATYTSFDTYSAIAYLGKEYVEGEQKFADTLSVTLTKTNLVDQVQRLDDQINPVIDIDKMSINELREYKSQIINSACQEDIFDGTVIEIDEGVFGKFGYSLYDQINYDELFVLSLIAPEMEYLPYHSNGNGCVFFTKAQVIKICSTLMMRKTQIITYTNALHLYINSLSDREDLLAVEYGMELPQAYQDNVNMILSRTLTQMEAFLARIMPTDDSDDTEPSGDEEPIEPTEPTEPEEPTSSEE